MGNLPRQPVINQSLGLKSPWKNYILSSDIKDQLWRSIGMMKSLDSGIKIAQRNLHKSLGIVDGHLFIF